MGAILVPMNHMLKEQELRHVISDSGAAAIIADPELFPNVAPIKTELKGQFRHLILVGEKPLAGHTSFSDLLQKSSSSLSIAECDPNDPAYIVYTSGTTGVPKGAVITHGGLQWCAEVGLQEMYRFVNGERIMSHGVLAHIGGLSHTLMSLYNAATTIASPRMTPTEDYLQNIYKYGATFALGIQVFLLFYLSHPEAEKYLGTINRVFDGGGPLPYSISHEFEERFGIPVIDCYSLTESALVGAYSPPGLPRKPGSCGVAIPGAQLKIVDENEQDLPPGETGEICIKSPSLMSGYWNRPEETEKTLKGGWLLTGDIGHLDDDGHLFVTDRKKDIILSNIWSIYPREVEEILRKNPKITDVAVIGVPDPVKFESVRAVVALKAGEKATEAEILEFCKERMAAYKRPQSVIFAEELPRAMGGMKISRTELKKIYGQP
jgi:long-chain acyl-CoA synthetase